VGHLAQQATAEYEAAYGDGSSSAYLDSLPGNYDAANPVSRAEAVKSLFQQEAYIEQRVRREMSLRRPRPPIREESESYDNDSYDSGWTDRDYQEAALLMDALSDLENA
jgi:hypothetical protein